MQPDPVPHFAYVARGGEEGLLLRAGSMAEIFEQAALALAGLLLPGRDSPGGEELREIELDAPDRAALLIAWLNELLYLAEHSRWVPSRIHMREVSETHLLASVWGHIVDRAPSLVKAATWHGLRFDVRDGDCEAEVLLDV